MLTEMVSYSDIDVSRDVLDIMFIKNSDKEGLPEFYLTLEEWKSEQMKIKLNFKSPLDIS